MSVIQINGTVRENVGKGVARKARGAGKIFAGVSHGVFCEGAFERIDESPIEELIVTDTISHEQVDGRITNKITQLSVAVILGEAVQRIHEERSLSSLFV